MNSWITAACVTALALGGLAIPAQVENNHQAEVLLQEAQHRALVDGDLERAIELCQQIIAERERRFGYLARVGHDLVLGQRPVPRLPL